MDYTVTSCLMITSISTEKSGPRWAAIVHARRYRENPGFIYCSAKSFRGDESHYKRRGGRLILERTSVVSIGLCSWKEACEADATSNYYFISQSPVHSTFFLSVAQLLLPKSTVFNMKCII